MKNFFSFLCVFLFVITTCSAHAGEPEKIIANWVKLSNQDLGEEELNNQVAEVTQATKKWYDALILFKKYKRVQLDRRKKIGPERTKLKRGLMKLAADMKADNQKKNKKYISAVNEFTSAAFTEARDREMSVADPTTGKALQEKTYIYKKKYTAEVLVPMKRAKREFRDQAAKLVAHCERLDKLNNEKEKSDRGLFSANSRLGRTKLSVKGGLKKIERREASIARVPNKKYGKLLLRQIEVTDDMIEGNGRFRKLWEF